MKEPIERSHVTVDLGLVGPGGITHGSPYNTAIEIDVVAGSLSGSQFCSGHCFVKENTTLPRFPAEMNGASVTCVDLLAFEV